MVLALGSVWKKKKSLFQLRWIFTWNWGRATTFLILRIVIDLSLAVHKLSFWPRAFATLYHCELCSFVVPGRHVWEERKEAWFIYSISTRNASRVSLSLSLSLSHTHTHTHYISLFLALSHLHTLSLLIVWVANFSKAEPAQMQNDDDTPFISPGNDNKIRRWRRKSLLFRNETLVPSDSSPEIDDAFWKRPPSVWREEINSCAFVSSAVLTRTFIIWEGSYELFNERWIVRPVVLLLMVRFFVS